MEIHPLKLQPFMTLVGSKIMCFLSSVCTNPLLVYPSVKKGSFCRFDYEKEDVVVFRKKNRGSKLACFAGRGLVCAPHTVVGEFMTDPESSFLWDKFLTVSSRHSFYHS